MQPSCFGLPSTHHSHQRFVFSCLSLYLILLLCCFLCLFLQCLFPLRSTDVSSAAARDGPYTNVYAPDRKFCFCRQENEWMLVFVHVFTFRIICYCCIQSFDCLRFTAFSCPRLPFLSVKPNNALIIPNLNSPNFYCYTIVLLKNKLIQVQFKKGGISCFHLVCWCRLH